MRASSRSRSARARPSASSAAASRLASRYPASAGPLRIGDDAYLGTGSVLLHGVDIGAGSAVAAGAVVREPVPGDVLVAGQPARVVKRLDGAVEAP